MGRSSLIPFHRVLITAGIIFCGGFAVWILNAAMRDGGLGLWLLGIVFAILAVGLGFYLRNLNRFLGLPKESVR